tara:strand:+ start:57 stop:494 length:438 start_codon:yes stop_codon:yes gene_type:complete
MTLAVLSAGTKIGISDGAGSPVYNKIPEVISMGTPEITRETIEVSSLDSVSKEFISGLSDGGSTSLEGNWLSGDTYHQLLKTNAAAGTAMTFLITLPNSPQTKVLFTATPESFVITPEPNSQLKFSFSAKVSGTPDWTTSAVVTG